MHIPVRLSRCHGCGQRRLRVRSGSTAGGHKGGVVARSQSQIQRGGIGAAGDPQWETCKSWSRRGNAGVTAEAAVGA